MIMLFHSQRVQPKSKKSIIMIMRALGAFSAFVFAIAIPGIYFAISIIAVQQTLTVEAVFLARSIGNIIQARPDLWEFESVKLNELLSKCSIHGGSHEAEIRTAARKLVIKTDFTEIRPIISVSAPFFDSGRLAGSILISHSIRPQIITTALLGILSSLFGCLTYYIFSTYPIRKLENTLTELQRARDELEKRVEVRTEALRSINEKLRTEITMRKQVEKSLFESQERFKSLVENTSDWIWEVDANGVYTYASPKVKDLLGYEPEELIGKTPFDFMPTEEAKCMKSEFGAIVASQKSFVGLENTNIHKDGSLVVIDTSGVPFFDSNVKLCGYRGIDRNITERKRTEEALREAGIKFRTLFEKSVHGILVVDLETKQFVYANPSICRMMRYSETEFLQLGVADIHPKDSLDRVISEFELQRRGEKALAIGLPCLRKNGTVFYADVTASPVIISNRECVMGFFSDVTERKALEDGLQKAYDDLKNLQTQLLQSGKLASIGELAAGVAHELNQPLMIIRTTAQLMLRKQSKNALDTVKLLENLNSIEKNTKRMMNIINHLRTFSRQTITEFTPVNVNKIIQDSFLMVGEQLSLRNIEVIQDFSGDLPKVLGDTNQLEQVFLNLLANARDAIESKFEAQGGGAELQKKIVITTHVSGDVKDKVEILFKDTGSGIPQEALKNIYDPFYTTKEVGKGTGLGLSISYGIIQDHKGEIDITETGQEGTTFRIRLPAA